MRKGKLFTGKTWKRIVRVLSCIVVFCTTYALILPAITQEAHAYCGHGEHQHTEQCYKEIQSCTKEEHTHTDQCFDADGSLICPLEEHVHDDSCTRQLLECTEEEHTHSLECFSDPEADKETEEDWKKTLPDEEDLQDKTDREKVVLIAQSQKGYKESDKNYQVENETETRGITRYGQWDEDPYEDWAGAFVRFVLHYAGTDTADAKKATSEWLEQLHDKEELQSADQAEPGDVIFVYDDREELKAGIVDDVQEENVRALMGDWDDKVQEKTFSKVDVNVHSIWKPVASDTKEEQPQEPVQDEEQKPEEEPVEEEEKPAEDKNTDTNKEEEQIVTYDFTQEVEAEDGAKIKVSWNAGTFETEDVVFQAKKVELTEEEQKKVQEQLEQDKNYTFRNYDLTFYVRDENMELQKVEPTQPVHVEIEFEGEESTDSNRVFHFADDGSLEVVEKTKEKLDIKTEKTIRFQGESFSVYTVATTAQERANGIQINSVYDLNREYHEHGNHNFYLGNDVGQDTGTAEWNKDAWLNRGGDVTIDLNGYSWNYKGTIYVGENTHLTIKNSRTTPNLREGGSSSSVNLYGHSIVFTDKRSNYSASDNPLDQTITQNWFYSTVSNISILKSEGDAIKVQGGSVTIENCGIVPGSEKTAIDMTSGTLNLNNTYVVGGNRGLCLTGGETTVDGGAVSDHGGNDGIAQPGTGIYVQNANTKLTLKGGVQVTKNISRNNNGQRDNGGGGIHVKQATLDVYDAFINGNADYCATDGGWATGGGIKGTAGAKIWLRSANSIISGNFSDNSGGGISLSDSNTTLYMLDGQISNNVARLNEGGGLSLQAEDHTHHYDGHSTAILFAGTISGNVSKTNNQWGGGGIFVGHTANLLLPDGADVTNNHAYVYGGGIAGCSTGKIVVDQSVINVNNTVTPAGSNNYGYRWTSGDKPYDETFSKEIGLTKEEAHDYFTCLYASVYGQLGGEGASWIGNVDKQHVIDINDGWLTSQYCMGLTSQNTNIPQNHSLKITNNRSDMNGGGILVNGYMVGGNIRRIYNSDTLTVNGLKKLEDVNGATTAASKAGYRFTLSDKEEGGNVISTATSDESGAFSFAAVSIQVPDDKLNGSLDYYVFENKSEQQGVLFDESVYKLTVNYRSKQSEPVNITFFNPKTNQNETIIVIEYTTTIDSVQTYKKSGDSWESVNSQINTQQLTNDDLANEFEINKRYNWSISLTGTGATFINKVVPVRDITVKKTWSDGAESHKEHTVTVTLLRDLKENHRSDPETVRVIILNAQNNQGPDLRNKWEYTWNDLPTTDNNGREYEYWVTESSSAPGYMTSIQEDKSGNQTTPVEEYVEQDAWVPAESVEYGKEYILVYEAGNKVLNKTGSTENGYGIYSGNTGTVSGYMENRENIQNYTNIGNAEILVGSDQRNHGRFLQSSSGSGYLVALNGNQGLQYLSSNYNDMLGFDIQNGDTKLYRWNGETNPDNVTFSNGSFGTSFKQGSNADKAKLYTRGKIWVKKTVEISTPGNIEFTITNTKISNRLVITKFNDDKSVKLSNAVFELYKDEYCTEFVDTYKTNPDGLIEISDLTESKYWLKEVKAPDGYEIPENPIIEISFDNNENASAYYAVDVTNKAILYELPETGSAGTKIYTATGTILLLTGTGLYRYKRRRNRKGGEAH